MNESEVALENVIHGIKVLHLDVTGYGPKGLHTRESWRAECYAELLKGKDSFKAWQESWHEVAVSLWEEKINAGELPDMPGFQIEFLFKDGKNRSRADSNVFLPYTLDFSGREFPENLLIHDCTFLVPVTFFASLFRRDVSFRGMDCKEIVSFDEVVFQGKVYFEQSKFERSVWFRHAIFHDDASFEGASFEHSAWFESASFLFGGSFQGATFEVAKFDNATFNFGSFRRATIKNTAWFQDALFKHKADFTSGKFLRAAVFFKTQFKGQSRFEKVEFYAECNFENAVFENVAHFEGAKFENAAPSFLGIPQHATMIFYGANFPQGDGSAFAVTRYCALKQLSEANGQTDQALTFNALELRARRAQPSEEVGFRIVTWGYELFSDCGRSFVRPLIAYIGLLLFTMLLALMIASYHSPQGCKPLPIFDDWARSNQSCTPEGKGKQEKIQSENLYLNGYRAAFEYGLYRATGVFDFSDTDKRTDAINSRLFGEKIEPFGMRVYGIIKSVLSVALLFLVFLGLRNRYRLK